MHADWIYNLKMLAADIPTLVPMAILGWQDQVAANARHKHESERLKLHADLTAQDKKEISPQELRAREVRIRQHAADREVEHYRKEWLEENKGHFRNDKEANNHFYENVAPDYRRGLLSDYSGGQSHKKDDEKTDKMLKVTVPIASLFSQIFKQNITESAAQRRRQNAWKMIKHLKEEVEVQCAGDKECGNDFQPKSADEISIGPAKGQRGDTLTLKEYIVEIFRQNERDSGRKGLGDNLISRLQPAIDVIAEHIANGSLDAYALVNLVGENKIIIHNGSKREFATKKQVEDAIRNLVPVMNTGEVSNQDEFFAAFTDPKRIQEIIKSNLEHMQGIEKAYFVSLLPEDLVKGAGVKQEEVITLRKAIHDNVYDIVAATVLYMAAMEPERLEKFGLDKKAQEAVIALAEEIKAGNEKALKLAVDSRNKTVVLGAVRTFGLNEQMSKILGEGQDFWAHRIKEAAGVRKKMAEAQKAIKDENQEIVPEEENIRNSKDSLLSHRHSPDAFPSSAVDREVTRRRHRGSESPEEVRGI